MSILPMLSAVLLERGFLIKTSGQQIYLTDNACLPGQPSHYPSYPTDLELLEQALKLIGVDNGLRRTYLVAKDQCLTASQVKKLFDMRQHVQSESGGNLRAESPRNFQRYSHGQKVPLALLDAHVALLAKGLSAAGCTTYSACDGHLDHPILGRQPLHVSLYGVGHTTWAHRLLEDARAAGLDLPDLHIQGDTLCERPESVESGQRNLICVWDQAIALGRHLYDNRQRLRDERLNWAKTFSFPALEPPRLNPKPLMFRVRLADQDGYAIEFSVNNYHTLESECRNALQVLWELSRGWSTNHVSIQAAQIEAPHEWKTPWNDPKPVWLKVYPATNDDDWQIMTRRKGIRKSPTQETRWLLLWMGIREAFPSSPKTTASSTVAEK